MKLKMTPRYKVLHDMAMAKAVRASRLRRCGYDHMSQQEYADAVLFETRALAALPKRFCRTRTIFESSLKALKEKSR